MQLKVTKNETINSIKKKKNAYHGLFKWMTLKSTPFPSMQCTISFIDENKMNTCTVCRYFILGGEECAQNVMQGKTISGAFTRNNCHLIKSVIM